MADDYNTTTSSSIDLSQLPAPTVIETLDFDALYQDILGKYKARYPAFIDALESDPVVKLLEICAYREMFLRQRINDAAKAVMLAYASGSDLDNLAALFGVKRLTITPADPVNNIAAVMESDADLRARILLAPESFSVAGPTGAYRYHALSADADVLDASASSPEAGVVLITVLSRTGDGTASDALLAAVSSHLSDDSIRPLTDCVKVQSAGIVPFSIDATIRTYAGPSAEIVLQQAQSQLSDYLTKNKRIGHDITISGIHAALTVSGVQNVILAQPTADLIIDETQVAYCTGISVKNGGVAE